MILRHALGLLPIACIALVQAAQAAPDKPAPDVAWNQAQMVIVGELTDAQTGPVASSMPPIYSNTLQFNVLKVLRGDVAGKKLTCSHAYRAVANFPYAIGKKYLVALSDAQGMISVRDLRLADDAAVKEVELACTLPMGWALVEGKAVSPWAALGKEAWNAQLPADLAKLPCDATGRPALLAGPGVEWSVQAVAPRKAIEWTNPDGDGQYTLTVTNPTDAPLTVPALLTQNNQILWPESIVILCQGKAYPCPGCKAVRGPVAPLVLKGKESASTVVNALALSGPDWPRGGSRVEFTFCLGEKARTMSFYYLSRYHDGLHDQAIKAVKGDGK